jgi:hypothetical protein
VGYTVGFTRCLSKWIRGTTRSSSATIIVFKETVKVPARGRSGFKHVPSREHEANTVDDPFKYGQHSSFCNHNSDPKGIRN